MPLYAFHMGDDATPDEIEQMRSQILRTDANESEGLCPNGCAPIVWDTPFGRHCPVCGFQGRVNVAYHGRVEVQE